MAADQRIMGIDGKYHLITRHAQMRYCICQFFTTCAAEMEAHVPMIAKCESCPKPIGHDGVGRRCLNCAYPDVLEREMYIKAREMAARMQPK